MDKVLLDQTDIRACRCSVSPSLRDESEHM